MARFKQGDKVRFKKVDDKVIQDYKELEEGPGWDDGMTVLMMNFKVGTIREVDEEVDEYRISFTRTEFNTDVHWWAKEDWICLATGKATHGFIKKVQGRR